MATMLDKLKDSARDGLNRLQDKVTEIEQDSDRSGWSHRVFDSMREQEARWSKGQHPLNLDYQAQVRLWYARLELEPGADAEAVRQSFRGLMRKYHPDRFVGDADTERLATQLSQELTVAYQGLLSHLKHRGL